MPGGCHDKFNATWHLLCDFRKTETGYFIEFEGTDYFIELGKSKLFY